MFKYNNSQFFLKDYYNMPEYTLINPKIKGTVKTTFDCKSRHNAALQAYQEISKYFLNN